MFYRYGGIAMKQLRVRGKEDLGAKLHALDKSQAIIEFDLDGYILTANKNFLITVGYSLDEIQGQHHSMFVDEEYKRSKEYREFWESLGNGEYQSAEYRRIGKDGREIWIQASYNPIFDRKGKPCKVVKFATETTAHKLQNADYAGQISAIGKSHAVIEFHLCGTIITANDNFLATVGYSLDEIKGKHHRMFVEHDYGQSEEYRRFWASLARGEYQAAQYKRIGKDGKEVWIQASYNPIFDMSGKPFKVVKYATDVTEERLRAADVQGQISAINKAQAVIHFNMDGTILDANENFLSTTGYRLDEIQGQHHRMFVEPEYGRSEEYRRFWETLNEGMYQSAEYKRFGKGGREVWIQASYNPIFDMNGKPFKVVKYATDITEAVAARREVSDYSGQTLMNVQTVASAAEELTSSISEISRTTMRSKNAMDDISAKAKEADHSTAELQKAALDMDNIVQLIESIAGQINLLALNATIESARAGDAGKGFAVVASEVKNLANQTTTATQRISSEIKAVQEVSTRVVDMLREINAIVNDVTESVSVTASAIEEQSAVTQEITANMHTAAVGVENINNRIKLIAAAA